MYRFTLSTLGAALVVYLAAFVAVAVAIAGQVTP